MTVIDYTSGTGNLSYTYSGSESLNEVCFCNDSDGDATVTINGIAASVKAGELMEVRFPQAFTAVSATIVGAYRLFVGR